MHTLFPASSQSRYMEVPRRRSARGKSPASRMPPTQNGTRGTSRPLLSGWETALSMAGNVGFVVGVVTLNKHVQVHHGFDYASLVTALHFFFTAVGLRILCAYGVFARSEARLGPALLKAALDCGSVGLFNVALAKNTVSVYQLAKVACVPVTVMVQLLVFGMSISNATTSTLVPLCLGVGLATVTDVSASLEGALWAAAAILATVASQILTKRFVLQSGGALQFLYHTSPIAAAIMFLMSLATGGHPPLPALIAMLGAADFSATLSCTRDLLLSSMLALGVNVTNYQVLSATSALTYQVLGHFKMAITLLSGFMFFRQPIHGKNIIAILLAFVGFILYAYVQHVEREGAAGGRGCRTCTWVPTVSLACTAAVAYYFHVY